MMADPKKIKIAAAVLLNEHGQLLLVRKRGSVAFMQPGGKIAPGESAEEALSRELKEELCLDLTPRDFCYVGGFAAPAANEPNHVVEADLFEASVAADAPRRAAEIEEIAWIDPDCPATPTLAPLTRDEILPRYRRTRS